MSRSGIMLIVLLIVGSLVLGVGARRYAIAQRQLKAAELGLASLTRDAQEVMDLRSRQERIGKHQRPTQDVIAQVNSALAEAAIPSNHLKSLVPESDTLISPGAGAAGSDVNGGAAKLMRQSLRLTLDNLSVGELGSFLIQWHQAQPMWTTAGIELAHSPSHEIASNHYDATILISTDYVADS